MALTSYQALWDAAAAAGITLPKHRAGQAGGKVFEATAEETLIQPTFVLDPHPWLFRRWPRSAPTTRIMSSGSSSLSAGWSGATPSLN
jgi:hypothetical protein